MNVDLRAARTVFRKELVDAFRDRRTLVATVVIPVLMYPLLMLMIPEMAAGRIATLMSQRYVVAVESESAAEFMRQLAKQADDEDRAEPEAKREAVAPDDEAEQEDEPENEGARRRAALGVPDVKGFADSLEFRPLKEGEASRDVLKERQVQAAVRLPADIGAELGRGDSARVEILFDKAEIKSAAAAGKVARIFEAYGRRVVRERIAARGLGPDALTPLRVARVNVATKQKMGGMILGMMVPFFLIMMVMAGGFHAAIDTTCGEKERKTLEALMACPASTLTILAGKFLVVSLLSLLSAGLNVASLVASIAGSPLMRQAVPDFGALLQSLPLILLVILPLSCLTAALLMALSSFAATFREAQLYTSPLMIVVLLPSMVCMVPDTELSGPLLLLPFGNVALLTQQFLLGRFDAGQILAVFGSTALYACGAMALAVKLYGREEVIYGGKGTVKLLLGRRQIRPAPLPGPAEAMLLLAVLFPVFYYGSLGLSHLLPSLAQRLAGSAALSWLLILGLPLLAAWYAKLDWRETFPLRPVEWRFVASAVLIGLCASGPAYEAVVLQFQAFGFPDEVLKQIDEAFAPLQHGVPLGITIVCLILTPAVCEEACFRGFVLGALSGRMKAVWAIVLCGLLFGAFHMSLFRLAPTFLLGCAIAWLGYRSRSLLPCAIAHGVHNAVALFALSRLLPGQMCRSHLPAWYLAASAAGLAVAFGLLASGGKRSEK